MKYALFPMVKTLTCRAVGK